MNKYIVMGVLWLASCTAAYFYGLGNKPEPETKEVVKTETLTKTITKIVETPGQKITIIEVVEKKNSESNKQTTPQKIDWAIGLGRSVQEESYLLQVNKFVTKNIYVGAYGITTGTGGVVVGVAF